MSPTPGRRRRLTEELEEIGLSLSGEDGDLLLDEIDHALRPPLHERRVSSSGAIIAPSDDTTRWEAETGLTITRTVTDDQPLDAARRFADGLSSWLVRRSDGSPDEWLVFDRPAGSERDLTIVAAALDATVVQRHPSGIVRMVGTHGVIRWDGFDWHREPPIDAWIDTVRACGDTNDVGTTRQLIEFAVHDLGANNIGALLVYREADNDGPTVEAGLSRPPPLRISRPRDLAPLRHSLGQIDGAAMFDADGVLRELGVRLVPSRRAEQDVEPFGGTRHTSGLRYSYDDPSAIVIAVSEDGPVSVLRAGTVLGRSDTVT